MVERPTIRQLEYAVAVADEGHFGRAAERCHVSQPALSAQIRELEHRLGVTLFERGRHGATPTAEATEVLAAARRVLADADEVVRAATEQHDDLVGDVTLAVIPTMAPYLLPAVVRSFRSTFPHARPVLREQRTDELLAAVRARDVELGLLAGPVRGDDLEVVELATDPFLLALPEGHPFAGDAPLPASALSGLPMLLLEDGHCLREQAIGACTAIGASTLGDVQATGLPSLCQMVAAGLGATLLPASAVAVEARPGSGLTVRPLRAPAPSRTVVLAWRRRAARAPHFRALADALRPTLRSLIPTPPPTTPRRSN